MDGLEKIPHYSIAVYDFVFHSVIFLTVISILFLRLYCRLTVGFCDSDKDMAGKTVLITGASSDSRVMLTKDGCERIVQVNHLGHFLLTLLLLDLMKKSTPSRIINVSSTIYTLGMLDPDDMAGTKETFLSLHIFNLYNRSKLANILFTRELACRLAGKGVTVNALHPGLVKSHMAENINHPVAAIFKAIIGILGKTPYAGAQTSIYLAVHPEVEKITGKFFYGCRQGLLFGKALDDQLAKQLFTSSEKAAGIYFSRNES